jgi:hypothetical protein
MTVIEYGDKFIQLSLYAPKIGWKW